MFLSALIALLVTSASSNAKFSNYEAAKFAHNPKACPCQTETDWSGIWEDIVFITDTTDEVGQSFGAIKQTLFLIAGSCDVSQRDGKYARIGIVNVGNEVQILANLTKYNSRQEMQTDLNANFKQLGGYLFRADLGLEAAQKIFDAEEHNEQRHHVKKVVVLFSSREIICTDSRKKLSRTDEDYPCRIAAQMKSNGIVIITVGLALAGSTSPTIDISTPCFRTVNNESMMSDVLTMLCKANCYCMPPYTQFKLPKKCEQYAECVYTVDAQLNYTAAQSYCKNIGATLTDILSQEKDQFLDEEHLDLGCWPYWVGQKWDSRNYYIWDSIQQSAASDYYKWKTGEPNRQSEGDCVVKTNVKFDVYWNSGICTEPRYFSCQKAACDVHNYCNYTGLP